MSWDGPLSQGKQQEPMAEVLEQAAEPPSPGSIQALAACGHGPAVGAVSSFKLEARWDGRSRSRRQRPGKVSPARSKPSCFMCTLPDPPCAPVLVPRGAPARPSRTLPGSFREGSWKTWMADACGVLYAGQPRTPAHHASPENPNENSLSSIVSRCVWPAALAVFRSHAVSRKFPGNFQHVTC